MAMEEGHHDAPATTFRADLFEAAENCSTDDDYRYLKARLFEPPPPLPDTNQQNATSDEIDGRDGTLLHAVLFSSGRVPLDLVACIIERGDIELATQKNQDGDTTLHIAVGLMPDRDDIAAFLIDKAPDVVQELNDNLTRPIDLISHKLIMVDEFKKYGGDTDVKGMWKTVHNLARASRPDISFQQPLVHACVVCPSFPVALLQRAIKQYPEQLNEANHHGDLPLHLMVRKCRRNSNEDEDDEEDVAEMNLFSLILLENIGAATALNNGGLSPLALAIQNGYGWNSTVVRAMISHAPASIGTLKVPMPVLPFLYQRLVQQGLWSATFALLQASPPTES